MTEAKDAFRAESRGELQKVTLTAKCILHRTLFRTRPMLITNIKFEH